MDECGFASIKATLQLLPADYAQLLPADYDWLMLSFMLIAVVVPDHAQ
jgi:hypothetical protein